MVGKEYTAPVFLIKHAVILQHLIVIQPFFLFPDSILKMKELLL